MAQYTIIYRHLQYQRIMSHCRYRVTVVLEKDVRFNLKTSCPENVCIEKTHILINSNDNQGLRLRINCD